MTGPRFGRCRRPSAALMPPFMLLGSCRSALASSFARTFLLAVLLPSSACCSVSSLALSAAATAVPRDRTRVGLDMDAALEFRRADWNPRRTGLALPHSDFANQAIDRPHYPKLTPATSGFAA